ncbi:DUF6691 family protein [Reyranella sp.]|uniref:DUF6691 family protein n=1 Tax=Reyranella sp. TaxID=1929291 RepID=UPI00273228F4|nr:DUF6691 family protein [Reyranella sp.]MDP2372523.1 YeeE/YedE family protein [Reyranella sp.]
MLRIVAAVAAGLLFGAGLTVSQMVSPAKVIGFLDVAGNWDPSLAFVLAGAVGTVALGFLVVRRHLSAPLFAAAFDPPSARGIDRNLVFGAMLFGIGWGLVGLCPGPALAALAIAPAKVALFVAAMLAGMAGFAIFRSFADRRKQAR